MTSEKVIKLRYFSKKADKEVVRWLEPYSFRDESFYGFDRRDGHIKKFLTDRIVEVLVTKRAFNPRWTVETDSKYEAVDLQAFPFHLAISEDE